MTDTVAAKPVPWRDGRGRVYWQPATTSGTALWWAPFWHEWERVWKADRPTSAHPVRYRSRRRAERVARRHIRRVQRGALSRLDIAPGL